MSRYWKAALPFLLAAVIILAAARRKNCTGKR